MTNTVLDRYTTTPAQEFWRHAAAMHDRVIEVDALYAVDLLGDLEILGRWFADLGDAEQQELLWAYGAYLSDHEDGASG